MKNLRILRIATICLVLFTLACQKPKRDILDLTVLRDISDEDIQYTSYGEVREILDFKRFLYFGHSIRTRQLSDIQNGIIAETHLPQVSENEVPPQTRKVQVRQFLSKTESLFLSNYASEIKETKKSVLYYGIAQELNRLAQSKATNRILIINSNLLENSKIFSVFRETDRKLLIEHPDSVIRLFEDQLALKDLTGISVYIVHHANTETDFLFSHMQKLYTYYLGLKGAKVETVANFVSSKVSAFEDSL